MQERILGTRNGGLKVSAIGLGCMGITYGHGEAMDYASAEKLLHSEVEMGITLFDSAEVYDGNEEVVGKALKPFRSQVAIVTKCGIRHDGSGGSVLDAKPETAFSSIDMSLQKLGTDYIDLYYLHRVDPNVPIEDVAGAMQRLIEQGKILHWGISEATANTIRRAHKICPITAIESEYSMMWTNPEKELFPTLEELGIGFMPFSPLGKGFLTGTMLAIGIPALRILAVAYFVSIPNMVLAAALQGLSLGTKSMYLTMTRQAALPLAFALILRLFGILDAIWLAFVLAELVGIPFAVHLWKNSRNKLDYVN